MSTVRMCDRCGDIFSERREGWSNGGITVRKRNERTGKLEAVEEILDYCPTCTDASLGVSPNPDPPAKVQNTYVKGTLEGGYDGAGSVPPA